MRVLTVTEMRRVSGAGEGDSSASGNNIGGVTECGSGSDLTDVYEALVAATSQLIERVANAL